MSVNEIYSFRRTCSAPCLSMSTQSSLGIHRSFGINTRHVFDDAFAESGLTSEFCIRERIARDNALPKNDLIICTFSRSRSCGFEPTDAGMEDTKIITSVDTLNDQDSISSTETHSNECICSNDMCPCTSIYDDCSLNDALPRNVLCCLSSLTAHEAAAIGVDIPSHRPMDSLEMVTWNLASPNNNPFELWVRCRKNSFAVGPYRSPRARAGDPRGGERGLRLADARRGARDERPGPARPAHLPHLHARHVLRSAAGARRPGPLSAAMACPPYGVPHAQPSFRAPI